MSNLAVLIFLSGVCLSTLLRQVVPSATQEHRCCMLHNLLSTVCEVSVHVLSFLFVSWSMAAVPAGEATKFSVCEVLLTMQMTSHFQEQWGVCVVYTQGCDPYATLWDGGVFVCLLPSSSTSILAPALSLFTVQPFSFGSEHTRFPDRCSILHC